MLIYRLSFSTNVPYGTEKVQLVAKEQINISLRLLEHLALYYTAVSPSVSSHDWQISDHVNLSGYNTLVMCSNMQVEFVFLSNNNNYLP